jgi:Protein of unknown function (DUF995)
MSNVSHLVNQEGVLMLKLPRIALSSLTLFSTLAFGQAATVLRDLDSQGRATLTKEDLGQLLPNASMSRINADGNAQFWKNDPGGTFTISSGQSTTAQGKWHVSDDGRYCVLIEWKRAPTEEWCRYIVKAGGAYYATRSDKTGTERVYRLEISKGG